MEYKMITQCRLCGSRFEETVISGKQGWFLARRMAGHPFEDAAAWCEDCLEQINATSGRLLAPILEATWPGEQVPLPGYHPFVPEVAVSAAERTGEAHSA
ncbi:MAG: hypothetical protein ACE5IG_06425 [Dehalococcoidia bacterium]